jgi:hypothetical protein
MNNRVRQRLKKRKPPRRQPNRPDLRDQRRHLWVRTQMGNRAPAHKSFSPPSIRSQPTQFNPAVEIPAISHGGTDLWLEAEIGFSPGGGSACWQLWSSV